MAGREDVRLRLAGWPGTCAAGLAGLLLGLLAIGPGIGPGYLLSYDMVFVPDPRFSAAMFGGGGTLPRAVPSDAVVTAIAQLLPADLVQKLVLLAIFALACAGLAALLDGEPFAARLAGGVCYAWNPFVGERLILGQWALLLGYAGLPWAARAVTKADLDSWRLAVRLAVALLPAAIGGFAAMCVSGVVTVPAALVTGGPGTWRRLRRTMITLAVSAVLSLPWLVPSLLHAVHTSGAGVAAFAARADTPFGSLGSLVLLGGAWNSQTVPAGYGGLASVAWLAVVLTALAGFVLTGRGRWPGLGLAAIAGLLIASIGITGPGQSLLRAMIAIWPGFAVLRDGQQFIAPLALVEAAGLGLMLAWVLGRQWTTRWPEARWLIVALAVIAPVAMLPGLAWGAAGRLRAVEYPASWIATRDLLDRGQAHGRALLLPWAAYRRFDWNHGEAVLDPWPRLASREVIWNDAVTVGRVTIPPESPQARGLNQRLESSGPLTAALLAAGVRYVIVDAGFGQLAGPLPASLSYPYRARLPGSRVLLARPGLVVYWLPAAGR